MNLRAILAVVLVATSLPLAAASTYDPTEHVSAHTILFDLTGQDPDLAAVAGHARSASSWFDGTIVLNQKSDGFVWATAAGAPHPIGKVLFPTGNWYNFTDDNGATWHVAEWFHLQMEEVQYMLAGHTTIEKLAYRVHVWTVHTSDAPVTDAGTGLEYNFVVVVDVTKLNAQLLDEAGNVVGTSEEAPGGGEIDLHFTTQDPLGRCSVCVGPRAGASV